MPDEFKSARSLGREEKKKNKDAKRSINPKEISELFVNALILLLITLVAGGILGVVYEVTKEPIARMEVLKQENANKSAMSEASSFIDLSMTSDLSENGRKYGTVDSVLAAYDENSNLVGYVMKLTTSEGYGGNISFSMGVLLDGKISAISITDISETAGLGMRAEEVLVPQFANRKSEFFTVVKTKSTNVSEIDAISSATVTSKALTHAVNGGLEFFRKKLEGGAENE